MCTNIIHTLTQGVSGSDVVPRPVHLLLPVPHVHTYIIHVCTYIHVHTYIHIICMYVHECMCTPTHPGNVCSMCAHTFVDTR